MKKTVKIFISMLLVMCIAVTSVVISFAEENNALNDTQPIEYAETDVNSEAPLTTEENEIIETPEVPISPDEPEAPDISDPNRTVATMYLCATASSFTGHVWLYFVNLTDEELPLGHVTLLPKGTMSVGVLGNTRGEGGGIYYNAEAYMARNNSEKISNHTTSLQKDITYSELEKINKKLDKNLLLNMYSSLFWNCGCMPMVIWNTVSDKKIIHIVFPAITIVNMLILGGEKGVVKMCCDDINQVYKHRKNGFDQVRESTVKRSCIEL